MADKRYEVIVSQKAMNMLAAYVKFLAHVSQTAALKLRDEIIAAAK